MEIFVPYFAREYLKSQPVKAGLKRLLCDRYRNDVNLFSDMFVNPTISLLSALKEKVLFCLFVISLWLNV